MSKNNLFLAFATTKSGLTWKRLQLILEVYKDFLTGFEDGFARLDKNKFSWLSQILDNNWQEIELFEQTLLDNQIELLSYQDELYPNFWRHLVDPPYILYTQGNLDLLHSGPKLTIVGSRRIQLYTERIAEKILKPACENGLITVSGLAFGVDALVHKISLKANSPTIAIVGSGLDEASFYPIQNYYLKNQIIQEKGLVISEYPVGTKGLPFYFPKRNRLLATLTEVTLVLQAGLKSGTLVTASLTQEYGKTLATIPASVLDSNYLGNIELLKSGAQVVSSAQDLYGLLGLSANQVVQVNHLESLEPEQKQVYLALSEPMDLELLESKSKIDSSKLIGILSMLELKNLVVVRQTGLWERIY